MRILLGLIFMSLSGFSSATDIGDILAGRGVWWDGPWDKNEEMMRRLDAASVRRVHIMLTEEPDRKITGCPKFSPPSKSRSERYIKRNLSLAKDLSTRSMYVIGTIYLPPAKEYIDYLFDPNIGPVSTLAAQGIVAAFELDLEGAWVAREHCGYENHAAAFADFKQRAGALGYQVGITTHSGHVASNKVPINNADFLSLQAYSKCTATDCADYQSENGPGNRQRNVFKRIAGYNRPVIIGLAAYGQKWSGRPAAVAMHAALQAFKDIQANNQNVYGHTYWSTKHISPNGGNPDYFKFLVEKK